MLSVGASGGCVCVPNVARGILEPGVTRGFQGRTGGCLTASPLASRLAAFKTAYIHAVQVREVERRNSSIWQGAPAPAATMCN